MRFTMTITQVKLSLLGCLILAAAVSFDVAGQTSGAQGDIDKIQHLIAEYAKAVDTADVMLVREIWSNSPDVSFIHPLGHEDVSIHTYGDTAWAEFYWDFAAKFRKDGAPLATKGRETQIYHKEQGRWRLVHVHYSGMPVTGEGRGF